MKTIVRIEHPDDGFGLFRSGIAGGSFVCERLSFHNDLMDKHYYFPVPSEDGLKRSTDDYCAFKSIYQLREWILDEWWDEIISLGFRVYQIDVSKCKTGDMQVLFKKEHIVSKQDITNIFKSN